MPRRSDTVTPCGWNETIEATSVFGLIREYPNLNPYPCHDCGITNNYMIVIETRDYGLELQLWNGGITVNEPARGYQESLEIIPKRPLDKIPMSYMSTEASDTFNFVLWRAGMRKYVCFGVKHAGAECNFHETRC
jgi:hypothetical protein